MMYLLAGLAFLFYIAKFPEVVCLGGLTSSAAATSGGTSSSFSASHIGTPQEWRFPSTELQEAANRVTRLIQPLRLPLRRDSGSPSDKGSLHQMPAACHC